MNKAFFILAVVTGVTVSCGLTASSAEASSLARECQAGSTKQVVACCKTYIQEHGRPIWMRSANSSCQSLVIKCSGKKGDKLCVPMRISRNDGGGDRPGKGSDNPGGNNPNGGNDPNGGGRGPTRSPTGAPL